MRFEPFLSFCAVVEKGSFHGAAVSLDITQPAVSLNIKQLEKEYGEPLLVRKGRGEFILTSLGKEIYEISRTMRDQMNKLQVLKYEKLRQIEQRITIECNVSAGIYLLTQSISKFRKENPGIQISIKFTKTDQAIQNVLEGISDLVLLLSSKNHPQLKSIFLWNEKMEIIAPRTNPLVSQGMSIEDLKETSFILPPKGSPTRFVIDEMYENKFGKQVNCLFELANPEALKKSVLSLDTPGVVLRTTIHDDLDIGMLSIIKSELDLRCEYVLYHKKNRLLSDSLVKFIKFLRKDY